MNKNKRRFFAVTVALLLAAGLWGLMLTGTALAQSNEPDKPGPGWHHDMMAGYMGQNMMGYGYRMQAGDPVTGTAAYGGRGMMGSHMGEGMLGSHVRQGMMAVMGAMGRGMMDQEMMADHMGRAAMGRMPMHGSMPHDCPYDD
jgi:hypothetical protein